MAKYYNAEEVDATFEKLEDDYGGTSFIAGIYTAHNCIRKVPIVNVAPAVHAHWIDKEEVYGSIVYRFRVCSNCYTKYDTTVMATCCAFIPSDAFGVEDGKFPKCPVCGAQMDEEVSKR